VPETVMDFRLGSADVFLAPDHVILVFSVELDKICAPSPDPDDEVSIFLRFPLSVEKLVAIYRVELHLVAAPGDEQFHEVGDLVLALLVVERALWNSIVRGPPFITLPSLGTVKDFTIESGPFSRAKRLGE